MNYIKNSDGTISIRGTASKQTKNDINEIKQFLQDQKKDRLFEITIIAHSKSSSNFLESNYRPTNNTLFVDKSILEGLKTYRLELLKTNETKQSKITANALKYHYPNFQINYKNENRERIKEIIGNIYKAKLETLKLKELNEIKKDQYDKVRKTNYTKRLNTIFFQKEDLEQIQFFITKTKPFGYRIKKLQGSYWANFKKNHKAYNVLVIIK